MASTWFFSAVGAQLTAHSIESDGPSLRPRASIQLPAWVQYAWPHPHQPLLYVVSSDGGPSGRAGDTHHASALRVDPHSGQISEASPPRALPSRPIHCAVDGSGRYLLTAFNDPSGVSVHRLGSDGGLGAAVAQPAGLDAGIFAHQIVATPSNRTAILVTRGNDATPDRPEDPGALKLYRFDGGRLCNHASIAPGGRGGLGFGPRHLDFHPSGRWVYVSVERQNQLQVFGLGDGDVLSADPLFTADSLHRRDDLALGRQLAGAVHVHPDGRFVYQSNRTSGLTEDAGWPVSRGGENSLVVYAIDAHSGAATPIQHVDTGSIHVRTFSLHPDGRLLIAATIEAVPVRTAAGDIRLLPAAVLLYRIGDDGRLTLARSYEVDTRGAVMWWTGIVTLQA